MKIRLNKQVLAEMDPRVREIVQEWKAKYRKTTINVVNSNKFYPSEDSRVTVINILSGAQATERTAGEFAGMTKLSPCAEVPLPPGVVAVEQYFFLGHPCLSIYQGSQPQINAA